MVSKKIKNQKTKSNIVKLEKNKETKSITKKKKTSLERFG